MVKFIKKKKIRQSFDSNLTVTLTVKQLTLTNTK